MLILHKALFEWLILGTPPALWTFGCLHEDIAPPLGAHTRPYPCTSIAATNLLPRGPLRLPMGPPLDNTPIPRDPHTSFPEAQPHSPRALEPVSNTPRKANPPPPGTREPTPLQLGYLSLLHRGPSSVLEPVAPLVLPRHTPSLHERRMPKPLL